jgi:Yip1-like protein
MIKALLLIFDPVGTWEKIENAHHRVMTIFLLFLLPLMLLTSAVEGCALMKFGDERGSVNQRIVKIPLQVALRYGAVQLVLGFAVVFGGAWLVRSIGAGFHRRHTYTECFTTLAYSLSPLFLARLLDAVPALNTWVCWGIGILLSLSALYRGIPRIMKPDPSNALGLYLISSLTLIIITGLTHFVTMLVLEEKILS